MTYSPIPVPDSTESSRQLNFALAVHYAAMISLAIAVNFTPVFLTTIGKDLGGLTNAQLGRIGSVTFLGLVGGILASAPLADRFGPRLFAMAGNGLIAAGLLTLRFCGGFGGLLAAVFLMGLGGGVLDMVLSPLVAALQPGNRTAAMNRLHSFYSIGAVGSVLGGALAIRWGMGWRVLSLLLTPIPVIVVLSFRRLRFPPLVAEGEQLVGIGTLFTRPLFLVLLLLIFLAGALEIGLTTWMAPFVERELGYSKWASGAALLGFCVAMALGRLGAGNLKARIATTSLLLMGCGVSMALILVICLVSWRGVSLATCVLVGFSCSLLWPSILALAADRFPQGGATLFGVMAAFGNVGGIVMPLAIGKIADHGSMSLALSSAALCPFIMAICLLWIRRASRAD